MYMAAWAFQDKNPGSLVAEGANMATFDPIEPVTMTTGSLAMIRDLGGRRLDLFGVEARIYVIYVVKLRTPAGFPDHVTTIAKFCLTEAPSEKSVI